ncbi:MAG: MBL fold metallo-hydrolase RNA specificity domain-containing protein [Acidobacteriota bacterium]
MPALTFLGATGTVTGSRYVLEAHGRRLLVDAGLFQGPKDLRLRNWTRFPVDPASLDAIVLTHAHIDHTGFLPRLVRDGFVGQTFVTPPTRRLLGPLLIDAAHLQEEEARYANKIGSTRHRPALPLFSVQDAQAALATLRPQPFDEAFELFPGVRFTFHRQGHILGAAAIEFRIKASGGDYLTIEFSGDVGRYDVPILRPPAPYLGSDYLVIESTYGDRFHDSSDPADALAEVIRDNAARRGILLIPAFAIDRTQEVLYLISQLIRDEAIPSVPIFLDSPMAREATAAYRQCAQEHDAEMRELRREGVDPLSPPGITVIGKVQESQALNAMRGPAIIVSASGMANGGRILHHLLHRLHDAANTVLFVGYQAEGTRGRRILDGEKEVKIFGQMVPVRAQVRSISSLSAHADADELTIWAGSAERAPRRVFVTHGEPAARQAMADRLHARLGWACNMPEFGETVEL